MIRAFLIAAATLMTMGADRPSSVDYRLGVATEAGGAPVLSVEMRLRGDADGETRIALPKGAASGPTVSGAAMTAPDTGHRLLQHRPGARLTVRYRLRAPGAGPTVLAITGNAVFAIPDGRADQAATLRWNRLPRGWRSLSDLDPGLTAWAPRVADLDEAVLLAGPDLRISERGVPGGVLRAAVFGDAAGAARLADLTAPLLGAQRAFTGDGAGSFLVAAGFEAASGGRGSLILPSGILTRSDPSDEIAQALTRSWIPQRLGGPASDAAGLMDGLAAFYADRIRLRDGLLPYSAAVSTLAMADTRRDAGSRGLILALKWDEDIRRKSAGKRDLDDVVLRMADHYRRFPPGQGPDVITGLISAAWVTAEIDLRPDLARYVQGSATIPLPETMFGGCLDARVTVSPGFDAGFDAAGSFAARTVRGVRRGGPAWNSGLRNGMKLESWTFNAGDMNREIELNIRPANKRAKPRKVRYWPYGDVDVETRKLQMAVGLSDAANAACTRNIAGL
jgi:hypothetical protein